MSTDDSAPRLLILDGHALIHRAYWAMRDRPLTVRRTGEVITAVYTFANTLLHAVQEIRPTHIAAALDPHGPTFRHEMDVEYKATRPEAPDDLVSQMGRVRELLDAFGIPVYSEPGYEADDALGTLSSQAAAAGVDTYLGTLDSDILQLVGPHVGVFMYRLYQGDTLLYDRDRVYERYGLWPEQLPDYKALVGDKSDNIPGVPGVGEKTAVKLLQQFGSVDRLLEQLADVQPDKLRQKLEQFSTQVRHARTLATIVREAPFVLDLDACALRSFQRERVERLFEELEFRSLLPRLDTLAELVGAEAPAGTGPTAKAAEVDYRVVRGTADLDVLVREAGAADWLAFDTETTGRSPMQSKLVGLSFATAPGRAWYVPVGHFDDDDQLAWDHVRPRLAPLFALGGPKLVAHNGKYDLLVLANHGIPPERLEFDTMVAAYVRGESVIEDGRQQTRVGLKAIARQKLGVEMTRIAELIGKGSKQISMAEVPVDRAAPYACADADMTLRLRELYQGEMQGTKSWHVFADIDMPLVPILVRVERAGIAVDTAVLREMSQSLTQDIRRLEREIYDQAGEPFNIGSPRQLSGVLFQRLGLPKTRRTTQGYTTEESALQHIHHVHPIIDLVLQWRGMTKLKSTYVDSLPGMINPETGRIHTTFNMTRAETGRLSSLDPNLQNIPVRDEAGKKIRSAFVPRGAGGPWWFLSADYSQIELRVLAHITGDAGLCAAFLHDEDIHQRTAAEVFGVSQEQVTSAMRRIAKVVNFGLAYGQTAYGLAMRTELSQEEAGDFVRRYFERFPGIRTYMEQTIAFAREHGYAETLTGRRRYLPAIASRTHTERAAAERQAINHPVQGLAADIIKIAMRCAQGAIDARGLRSRMLLQIHDELLFECPEEELDAMEDLVRREMSGAFALRVPLKVDLSRGQNWGEID